jgi:hypothetical protein
MAEADVLERLVDEQAAGKRQKSSCMAKLDRLGWVVCNWYEIEGYRFGVRSTSTAFGAWVDHCLGAYRVDGPLREDDDPMWAVVVEDVASDGREVGRRFHILYHGTWDVVRTLDIRTVARAFLAEMSSIVQPVRDDALYLQAAVASASGVSVLVPHVMVPGLARAVRRVQRAGVVPPGTMVVAVDPDTGRVVPSDALLDMPADAWERFGETFPANGSDPRVFVDDELAIDAVLTWGGPRTRGLFHASKAETLKTLAPSIRNLRLLGGRGIQGLGRLVANARCYTAAWVTTNDMIDFLAGIAGAYASNRP